MNKIDTNIQAIKQAHHAANNNIQEIDRFISEVNDAASRVSSDIDNASNRIKGNLFTASKRLETANRYIEKYEKELIQAQATLESCIPPYTETIKVVDSQGVEFTKVVHHDPDASKRIEATDRIKYLKAKIEELKSAREAFVSYIEELEDALKGIDSTLEELHKFLDGVSSDLSATKNNYYEAEEICLKALQVLEEYNGVSFLGNRDVTPLDRLSYKNGHVVVANDYHHVSNTDTSSRSDTNVKETYVIDFKILNKAAFKVYLDKITKESEYFYLKIYYDLRHLPFINNLDGVDEILMRYSIKPIKTAFGTRKMDVKRYYIYER